MVECKYCKTTFSDKSSLNRHLKNSCNKNKDQKEFYECEFCKKKLTRSYSLKGHYIICKFKLKQENKEKVITTVNNINNNINNNNITIQNNNYGSILNLSNKTISESFKNYSIKDLLADNNQSNLADITMNNLLLGEDKPIYLCKDRSRNKFTYTDEKNEEKEDPNAIMLRTLIYKEFKPILKKLYKDELIALNIELARCLRLDDSNAISSSREDIKNLEESFEKINILKDGDDYIYQLSKCLPSSIKDRIYRDHILKIIDYNDDSDDEYKKDIKRLTRRIGNYTISELIKYKTLYKKNFEIKGPKDILCDPKYKEEYIIFLKE